jgi:two-component system osmolarity sensor histidine kinase EnvZ
MARISLPPLDSLFTRLLLTQLGLVTALMLVFGALFFVERNATIAVLYADLWAPQLALAAGVPGRVGAPLQVQRSMVTPENTHPLPTIAPRFVALRQRLQEHGLQVDDMRLGRQGGDASLIWLQIRSPNGNSVWLGVARQVVLPEWPVRLLIAMASIAVLMVVASWTFTRRLTRPLEQLRKRMQTHRPGAPLPAQAKALGSSSEIMAMDTAYTELLERLEQHQRERSLLLAGVSHDLRSPLARIRMAAGLLPDAPGSTTRQDSIARNVVVADQLIESFLDFVRSDSLAFDQTVDLAEAARQVAARFERSADELVVVVPATLPWPQANALLVERLMTNLVDNALKHGCTPVILRLSGDSHQARLTVEDAGTGIAPPDVTRLQEAFSRGNDSRTVPGTGLGLAIVRQIAQRLGGVLEFDSQPDGCTVRLTLHK